MTWPALNTLLTITPLSGQHGLELTPYAARGLHQTLEQYGDSANFIRETVDGRTIDLTPAWMKKYQSTITCTDVNTPCLSGAWRGLTVQVDCAIELNYKTATGSAVRNAVSGSSRTEGDITFFRPSLIMMVTSIRPGFAEWAADYDWQIDLREVAVP